MYGLIGKIRTVPGRRGDVVAILGGGTGRVRQILGRDASQCCGRVGEFGVYTGRGTGEQGRAETSGLRRVHDMKGQAG